MEYIPPSSHLLKHLINQFKTSVAGFLLLDLKADVVIMFCKQASKTVLFSVFRADSWKTLHIHAACHNLFLFYSKLLSNNQTHNISPPAVLPSLDPSRHGVFVSLVLWQLGSCSVQLTFLSSQIPQGSAPPLPIAAPAWGNQTDAGSGRW